MAEEYQRSELEPGVRYFDEPVIEVDHDEPLLEESVKGPARRSEMVIVQCRSWDEDNRCWSYELVELPLSCAEIVDKDEYSLTLRAYLLRKHGRRYKSADAAVNGTLRLLREMYDGCAKRIDEFYAKRGGGNE